MFPLASDDCVLDIEGIFLRCSDRVYIFEQNINKENRGDLTDVSVKTKNSACKHKAPENAWLATSDAVLAEISLKSPQKIFIFIIKKLMYRIEVSQKYIN